MTLIENRTYDGHGNNVANPDWGAAGTRLLRKNEAAYADKQSQNAVRLGANTNARHISNVVCKQDRPTPDPRGLTDFVWAWGQFLDHEMDLTKFAVPDEIDPILVAEGDPRLENGGSIEFQRSAYDQSTGTSPVNPRQQTNSLSAFIDAANVYGVDAVRASALRVFDGTGQLKITESDLGPLLPYNFAALENAQVPSGRPSSEFFLAGDIRANEHAVLTCMHTVFVREHNRLCDLIKRKHNDYNDEQIYQLARKIVGGLMQSITFNEFLPALLGSDSVSKYRGYDPATNPGIDTVFSTACYRLGHSMIPEKLKLGRGRETIPLMDAFFAPEVVASRGVEPFLQGLARQTMQAVDVRISDSLREFLFVPPNASTVLLDLPAINIERGRDHGLPDYNTCREAYGLARKASFAKVTRDRTIQRKLASVYRDVDCIDPWVGALAEDHVDGASVGELVHGVLKDQFERLRDGDRFWHEIDAGLSAAWRSEITGTRLFDVIKRNTRITGLSEDLFSVGRPRRAA